MAEPVSSPVVLDIKGTTYVLYREVGQSRWSKRLLPARVLEVGASARLMMKGAVDGELSEGEYSKVQSNTA